MKIYSKNRSFFFSANESKNWTLFFFGVNVTQRTLFVKYDSNGTFFWQIWHRIEPFLKYDSKNCIFFKKKRLKEFLNKKRLKELNSFKKKKKNMTQRIEVLLNMTQIFFFQNWLPELNFFFKCDSKKIELFFAYDLKNWLFYGKMSQIFEPFLNMTQRIDFFHIIPIIEPYFKIDSQNWIFLKLF